MSKVQLLKQISEVNIIQHYYPDFNPKQESNYKSPFSETDDNPSLHFYEKNGKWLFKSHNTGHQGDVFQFVADLKGINCKNNFNDIISEIQKDCGLVVSENINHSQNVRISFDRQGTEMISYFTGLGISAEILERYQVKQVKFHEFITRKGKRCKFDYKKLNNVAICYQIEDRIKVYFPEIDGVQAKNFGFKDQNLHDIFGLDQLEGTYPTLFITAGEKDCLSLIARGFVAISFQSENAHPTAEQIEKLNALSSNIYIVFDSDTPGQKAAEKLSAQTGWKVLSLPTEIKDVTDFFKLKSVDDFVVLSTKATVLKASEVPDEPKVYTIFHQTEDYLKKRYDFRFNEVSLDIEGRRKSTADFKTVNENNIFVELNKAGVKVSKDNLIAILKSDFVPHFNPVVTYFTGLPPWDKKEDHIANLAMHLHADRPTEMHAQFRKWLVRCVRCVIEPGYFNKQAFILVHSQQNSGKTSFCRFLCPPALSNYLAENISDDKDSRISLVKNFLINLDELSGMAKHEINSLKALFSKAFINERLPYDKKNSIIPRISNFIGSTNLAEFLSDETGSVRWLCFEIHKIDWGYRETIDINKVWAQVYYLYKTGFECDMNANEIAENEARNSKFQQLSAEAEIIPMYLKPAQAKDPDAVFLNATQILEYLTVYSGLKLSKVMVGKAMPTCGFERVKDHKTDRYGYYATKLKE